MIRQLIELRIRRAFGIISFIDHQENIRPLDMSLLFESISKYQNEITFPVKLNNIECIYRWPNMFIHAGLVELSWMPYFIQQYLRPLTFGDKDGNGNWNINNGIKTTPEILKKISQELCNGIEFTILSCKPECELLMV